jgi:hypothetical protein
MIGRHKVKSDRFLLTIFVFLLTGQLWAADTNALLLEEVRDLYRKFDYQTALVKLDELQKQLPEDCQSKNFQFLRDVFLLEGLVHFSAGNRQEALASFKQVATWDISWEPDPKDLAPKIIAAYYEARHLVQKQTMAKIEIEGMPSGAKININGKPWGQLPQAGIEVPPGEHCVQIALPDYDLWHSSVSVVQGEVKKITLIIPLKKIDKLHGERIASSPLPPLELPQERPVIRPASDPWYKEWWFWSLVGCVAVGTGVGLGYLLLPGSEDSRHSLIITKPTY